MTAKRHAVILGIDGMPLELFHLLFEHGAMPFTKSVWHKLWSLELDVLHPFTLSSWATISTGVNPGKHGIFDFIDITDLKTVTKSKLEYPYINDIVAFNGLKAITINVPLAYPPFVKKNNIVISSWIEPKLTTWPSDEIKIVKKYTTAFPHVPNTLDEYIDVLIDSLENRIRLIEEYYLHRDWNLFYAVVAETDWLFHYLYGGIVKGNKLGKKALKIFILLDNLIKVIYQNIPDKTMLIMCSDHGFMEAHKSLNINVFLKHKGLLKTRENRLPLKSRLILKITQLMPSWLKARLKYSSMALLVQHSETFKVFATDKNPIDYEQSIAFATISYNLYISRRLPLSQRLQVKNAIIQVLRGYRDMLDTIVYGEHYFWGPYVNRAPDVVLLPRKGFNISTRLFYRSIVEKGKWYIHSNKGFIAIHIEDDESSEIMEAISDRTRILRSTAITPLVLYYLNLPLDPYMDESIQIKLGEKVKQKRYDVIAKIGKRISRIR